MTTYGYARVSTDGQSLRSQTEALQGVGCARIFAEKISGAYSDRPQLAKAIAALGDGNTLVVCKLDRLARSTRDLLNTLDAIGKAGASFRSLSDQWADTTTPHGRLMLTVLGGLAEFERSHQGTSQWREVWEKANADALSTCRGIAASSCWRDAHRDRAEHERKPHDYRADRQGHEQWSNG
jgi:DNA invertase Pin-like site-specific DNA recombinase